ncbi:outer membrane protein assembly factor BamD [Notoacmeibacter sp. MSK16QG-6]|uniref:outer membrane protein assembly factor BamD n=1 Tax=Notoacmeibacter sp. MSK16QG-6 TaxID=2957982 RepID=UPI0020A1919D|nr:outer membrane protein assembly factor BamD [Notoacmeibacter sp. MSK16QG-6]MCP1199694.1 outer membrane protein assembly factor BamD [Notoacmeibacter sp. MSK16QG-6]
MSERIQRVPTGALKMIAGAAVLAVLPALGACTSTDDADLALYVENIEPADRLYNQGLANLEAGRMTEAGRKFKAVENQHPYTDFGRKALVMQAFTQYRQGQFDDAIQTAKRYTTLYPATDDAAYATYIAGLSYWRQIEDVTRDQEVTKRMIQVMNQVVTRWPDSEYVEDAEAKIRFGRDQLAGKEMQVGRYYLERREYLAAIRRFRYVVENYSNTRHVEEALARLTESYLAMGLVEEAQNSAAVLGYNFPDSQWYKDAYALLTKGGYTPQQSAGGWLSRVGFGKKSEG